MTMTKPPAPIARMTGNHAGRRGYAQEHCVLRSAGLYAKARASGEAIAFFDTGASVLALFPWDQLAQDADIA